MQKPFRLKNTILALFLVSLATLQLPSYTLGKPSFKPHVRISPYSKRVLKISRNNQKRIKKSKQDLKQMQKQMLQIKRMLLEIRVAQKNHLR